MLTGTLCVSDVQGIVGLRQDVARSACCDRSDPHEVAAVFDNFSHFTHPQGYKTILDVIAVCAGLIQCLVEIMKTSTGRDKKLARKLMTDI